MIKQPVKLRDYQNELLDSSLDGSNCMVVAPTGSGKTYVSLGLCIKHLNKTDQSKIIILVPKAQVLKQHVKLFEKYINSNQICQAYGKFKQEVPKHILFQKHKISFMTAQILLNLLSDGLVKLSEISLLIFDECHHTIKNEPYNHIMGIYLDEYIKRQDNLPQIVGFTASPGIGAVKDKLEEACLNVKTLMASLNVTKKPIQVVKHKSSLLKVLPRVEYKTLTKPVKRNTFYTYVEKCMSNILQKMKELQSNDDLIKDSSSFPAIPGTHGFETWAGTLLKKSKLIKADNSRQILITCAYHLKVYNNSLQLNYFVTSFEAKKYIDEKLFKRNRINEIEDEIANFYPFNSTDETWKNDKNPLLSCLVQKLNNEFSQNQDSKCIVFVKAKAIAQGIVSYLQTAKELECYNLNPKKVTGSKARKSCSGMTVAEQGNCITDFKSGKCKLLVSTSVAEEGIDIKDCNLIISYDYSTNEIGRVQRRGRGRAENTKNIMITYENSAISKREERNELKEKALQEALDTISKQSEQELTNEILEIQNVLKEQRERYKEKQLKNRRKLPTNTVFHLQCLWCGCKVTTSDKLYHITNKHYVVGDEEFKSRAEITNQNQAEEINNDQSESRKIFCKNTLCKFEWGHQMLYRKILVSVLKIENFLITDFGRYRGVVSRWKDAPFTVHKELTSEVLIKLVN